MTPISATTQLEREIYRETVERRKRLKMPPTRPYYRYRPAMKETPKPPPIIEQPQPEPAPAPEPVTYSKLTDVETIVLIQHTTALVFKIAASDILGRARDSNARKSRLYNARLAFARHTSLYLCRQFLPSASLAFIAKLHGRSDHTIVINSTRKIDAIMRDEPRLARWVYGVCRRVGSHVSAETRVQSQDEAPRVGKSAGHLPEVWAARSPSTV